MTITIDSEYGPDAFWTAFRAAEGLPRLAQETHTALLRAVRRGESSVSVLDDQGASLLDWASELPEFDGGPEHAPCPLCAVREPR